MKLLLKAALQNRRHLSLLAITLFSMLILTLASQLEMFALGVIAKTGPDIFALFGHAESGLTLETIQSKWPVVAPDGLLTVDGAQHYLASQGGGSLVQRVSLFLDRTFGLSGHLLHLALFLVAIALFKALSLFSHRYTTQLVAIRVSRDLRQRVFEHIQSLPMSFYQDRHIGSISTRIFGDAGTIASAINSLLINYIQTPIAALSTLIACFFISWKLSLFIFIGFPLVLLPIIVLAKRIKLLAKEMQRNQEGFASVLIDFLAGILTVKVFAMEDFSRKKYRKHNFEMAKLEERSARFGVASRPLLHTIASLFFAAVIVLGLYLFQMKPADLLVFAGLLYIFYEPIKKFAEENHSIYRGVAAAERMEEVMREHPTIVDRPDSTPLAFERAIEFRSVHFAYQKTPVLHDLSFTIRKGEVVALVGPTGSGKSTIAQLITRLYEADQGSILIDGRSIASFQISSLRENIAFVPQKPFLFYDTVHANIAFGRNYSRSTVVDAAKRAHADEFIERLPQKYDSMLAEAGKNLSGGQQQRLAIARALVKGAPILILDEATSALDAMSESRVKEAVDALRGEITQIIIAHRLTTIEHADRIIYLEGGRKIAEGTRDELLQTCPPFAHAWEMMQVKS